MSPSEPSEQAQPVGFEFIARVALLISLVALSTDAMLPVLPEIGSALSVAEPNAIQMVVTVFMAGLMVGQFLAGPLSDAYGRKMIVYLGLAIFVVGCLLSAFGGSFEVMLIGRFLQGLGAAAPRIVMVAIVRDQSSGRAMARIMSFVMAVFILVPAIAPALGQWIAVIAGWRMIFSTLLAVAIIGFFWFAFRQTETLSPHKRLPFSLAQMGSGIAETVANRQAFGYTIAAGFAFGGFLGYLSSAQQIFEVVFQAADRFPLYFALLALAIGAASVTNSAMVMRFGMRRLCVWALLVLTGSSFAFLPIALADIGPEGLMVFMIWAAIAFFCFGVLFGNFNALAMEPLGHIAGIGAAVVGSLTTAMALVSGIVIGQLFDGSAVPLVAGFASLGLVSLIVVAMVERGLPVASTSGESH